jgi:hypothetical protein
MDTPNRVIKTKLPMRVVISAILIGVAIVGFLVIAFVQSGRPLVEARMAGQIISKEFQPYPQPEHQITLSRTGAVRAEDSAGQFLIAVEVPQKDGSKKVFNVWLPDQRSYDAVKIGDSFDVGPYLVPSAPEKKASQEK